MQKYAVNFSSISPSQSDVSPLQAYTMKEKTLFYVLWSMHVQVIAMELGWHDAKAGEVIAPFLSWNMAV